MLRIFGGFSFDQAHSWIRSCLPDTPERLQGHEASFVYRGTFIPSFLKCTYRKAEAVLESDSLITLAILKDYVTKEATATKTQIDIRSEIADETVEQFLMQVGPVLDFQLNLQMKHGVIEALHEVQMQESNLNFLAEEYRETLDNATLIRAELQQQPMRLMRLRGLVIQLFVERARFQGQTASARSVNALQQCLQSLQGPRCIDAVISFFQQHSV